MIKKTIIIGLVFFLCLININAITFNETNVSSSDNSSIINFETLINMDELIINTNNLILTNVTYIINNINYMIPEIVINQSYTTSDFPLVSNYYFQINTTQNHTIDEQYFIESYNITSNINYTLENVIIRELNVNENYTLNISYGEITENHTQIKDIITETNYYIGDSIIEYGISYNVSRNITINNNLNYSLNISQFNLKINLTDHVSSENIQLWNGSNFNDVNYSITSPYLNISIPQLNEGENTTYRFYHKSNILLKSTPNISSVVDGQYQKFFFNPYLLYYTNFNITESKNYFDSINLNDLNPFWQYKTLFETEFNELTTGYSVSETGDIVDLSFSQSNFINSTFQIYFYVNEKYLEDYNPVSQSTPTSSSGGSGGSSTNVDLSLQKQVCDILFTPQEIKLDDSILFQEIKIQNNELFGYEPELIIEHIEGEEGLTNSLRLTNTVSFIDTDKTVIIGLRLSTFLLNSGNTSSRLILKSDKCRDVVIPIEIKIINSKKISDYIDEIINENKSITQMVIDLSEKQFFKDNLDHEQTTIEKIINKTFSVSGLSIIISLIILIVLIPTGPNPKQFSSNKFLDFTSRLIIWTVVSILSLAMVWVIYLSFYT